MTRLGKPELVASEGCETFCVGIWEQKAYQQVYA